MQEELLKLLFVVLGTAVTCAVTAAGNCLVRFIREKIASQKAKDALETAARAVQSGVAATAQTYVDALKKAGKFDAEAQKNAFESAKERALSMLSEGVKKTLCALYGDVNAYLEAEIETAVRQDKAA
ncbi:MAG: hypothetical protein DBX59_02170 [Bacillota bacterium]|nr:MAG: hypothetical protein DBX59_02170 [Bacillota bacterium]